MVISSFQVLLLDRAVVLDPAQALTRAGSVRSGQVGDEPLQLVRLLGEGQGEVELSQARDDH
jgi:hypothetical protein